MPSNIPNEESILVPSYNTTGDIVLKNQNTLRKLVGILGMSLPVLLFIFLLLDAHFSAVLPSISHYYYTRVCGIFIISISLLAIFLLIYKGEERKDYYASSLAGIFALVLVLFPTDNLYSLSNGLYNSINVSTLNISKLRTSVHFISAAIFLMSLNYMSFFLFTKSNLPPSERPKSKVKRNRIYRTCSLIMTLSFIVILLGYFNVISNEFYSSNQLTFWMEVLAVEAFGLSWMVKGEAFFTDKK